MRSLLPSNDVTTAFNLISTSFTPGTELRVLGPGLVQVRNPSSTDQAVAEEVAKPMFGHIPVSDTSNGQPKRPDAILTVKDAAKRLGISEPYVSTLLASGKLLGHKRKHRWVIKESALNAFANRTVER